MKNCSALFSFAPRRTFSSKCGNMREKTKRLSCVSTFILDGQNSACGRGPPPDHCYSLGVAISPPLLMSSFFNPHVYRPVLLRISCRIKVIIIAAAAAVGGDTNTRVKFISFFRVVLFVNSTLVSILLVVQGLYTPTPSGHVLLYIVNFSAS